MIQDHQKNLNNKRTQVATATAVLETANKIWRWYKTSLLTNIYYITVTHQAAVTKTSKTTNNHHNHRWVSNFKKEVRYSRCNQKDTNTPISLTHNNTKVKNISINQTISTTPIIQIKGSPKLKIINNKLIKFQILSLLHLRNHKSESTINLHYIAIIPKPKSMQNVNKNQLLIIVNLGNRAM
jgi:hypothetical protein